MKLHSPLPQSIEQDIIKCAHILQKFSKKELLATGSAGQYVDKAIPPNVIRNCKGIAIMTVVKAGFIWSGRTGTGLVVARLADGRWSAPSAIGTAGMGIGGQIGAELTDFVIILNTKAAVDAFSMGGNFTLGGNLSVAAGPFGRSAEAAGAIGKMAPIFSYSKTKGLFIGVSLEGSVIVERKDANLRFYGNRYLPKEILNGEVDPPEAASALYQAIEKQERQTQSGLTDDAVAAIGYASAAQASVSQYTGSLTFPRPLDSSRNDTQSNSGVPTNNNNNSAGSLNRIARSPAAKLGLNKQSSYSKPPSPALQQPPSFTTTYQKTLGPAFQQAHSQPPQLANPPMTPSSSGGSMHRAPPPVPKRLETGTALYDFEGERETDLSFSKGDDVIITRRSDNLEDWWTGSSNGRTGDFPANYITLR